MCKYGTSTVPYIKPTGLLQIWIDFRTVLWTVSG